MSSGLSTVTLALLAGGKGRRMGLAKHRLQESESGSSLIAYQLARLHRHFPETFVLCGDHAIGDLPIGVQTLADPPPFTGDGPLAGMLAGMAQSQRPWMAVLALDYPEVPPELFEYGLSRADDKTDAVIFLDSQKRAQWLCALYRTRVAPQIERSLRSGERAVRRFAQTLKTLEVDTTGTFEADTFSNLNDPEDLAQSRFCRPGVEDGG